MAYNFYPVGAEVNSSILGKCEVVENVESDDGRMVFIAKHSKGFLVSWDEGYLVCGNFGADTTIESAQETAKSYLDDGYGLKE
jgi:hypothetical protein